MSKMRNLKRKADNIIYSLKRRWEMDFTNPPATVTLYTSDEDLAISKWLTGKRICEVDFNSAENQTHFLFTSVTPEAGGYYLGSLAFHLVKQCAYSLHPVASQWYWVIFIDALSDQKTGSAVQWLATYKKEALRELCVVLDFFVEFSTALNLSEEDVDAIKSTALFDRYLKEN